MEEVAPTERPMVAENQPRLTQLFEHRWPTESWYIAQLTVRLEEIATQNHLTLQHWTEDGLGPAIGCGGRLPSGVVIQLEQYEHAAKVLGATGPNLQADMRDVQQRGIDSLIAETIAALQLSPSDVDKRNRPPTGEEVARFDKRVEEVRRRSETESSASD